MNLDIGLDNNTMFDRFLECKITAEKEIDFALDTCIEKYGKIPTGQEFKKHCEENDLMSGYWYMHKIGFKLYLIAYVVEKGFVPDDSFDKFSEKPPEVLNIEMKYECKIEDLIEELEGTDLTEINKGKVLGVTINKYKYYRKLYGGLK
jgi:hypothetical protein